MTLTRKKKARTLTCGTALRAVLLALALACNPLAPAAGSELTPTPPETVVTVAATDTSEPESTPAPDAPIPETPGLPSQEAETPGEEPITLPPGTPSPSFTLDSPGSRIEETPPAATEESTALPEASPPPVRLVVKQAPGGQPSETPEWAGLSASISNPALEQLGFYVLLVPADEVEATLLALQAYTSIASVEIDQTASIAGLKINDPLYEYQSALELIGAPAAWSVTTGSSNTVIAFLDTGLDLTHIEFSGRILPGYDFVNSDTDPSDDSWSGHGTLVTGIAVAAGRNHAGIAGLNWNAQIMPIKVLDSAGNGSYTNVAAGIIWAVDNGADVINLSLGGSAAPGAALDAAIAYAEAHGVVVVAAAGNGNTSLYYPAQYASVIAVGAVDNNLERLSYSNYGPELDVVALGDNLVSTVPGGGYATAGGTSAAAPQVAALAALLLSLENTLSPGEITALITTTALDLGDPGFDVLYGAGLIQMDIAVLVLAPPQTVSAPDEEPASEETQPTATLIATGYTQSAIASPTASHAVNTSTPTSTSEVSSQAEASATVESQISSTSTPTAAGADPASPTGNTAAPQNSPIEWPVVIAVLFSGFGLVWLFRRWKLHP